MEETGNVLEVKMGGLIGGLHTGNQTSWLFIGHMMTKQSCTAQDNKEIVPFWVQRSMSILGIVTVT